MDRRTYLASSVAAGAAIGLSGCLSRIGLGGSPGAHDDVVLEEPEKYDRLRESRDGGHLSRPIHGDELPEATVPAPLQGDEVSTTDFAGDRHVLLTFIFTRCVGVCSGLVANMVQVQADANDNGYASDMAFLPTTFDPEYDTGERLADYSEDLGADVDAANWIPLRPASEDRVDAVISEKFGVAIEENADGHDHHDHGEEDHDSHGDEPTGEDSDENNGDPNVRDDNHFLHAPGSYILANQAGYVERGYPEGTPNPGVLLEDVETLIDRW